MAHLCPLGQDRVRRLLHRRAVPVGHLPATGQTADALEIGAGKDPHTPGIAAAAVVSTDVSRAMGPRPSAGNAHGPGP